MSRHDFIISSAMPRDFVVIPLALFQWEDSHGGGTAHRSRIGGMSGGVPNDELVTELKEVALEHVRISRNPDCESTSRFICGSFFGYNCGSFISVCRCWTTRGRRRSGMH